jgi:hypothetical protein
VGGSLKRDSGRAAGRRDRFRDPRRGGNGLDARSEGESLTRKTARQVRPFISVPFLTVLALGYPRPARGLMVRHGDSPDAALGPISFVVKGRQPVAALPIRNRDPFSPLRCDL